jgi:hypothetical protein
MRIIVLLLSLLLSGCAGMDAVNQYEGIDPPHFQYNGATWRIFDKPNEGKLMITPTIGEAMTEGLWRGLTLGAIDTDMPKSTYQAAVEGWLTYTHRKCVVMDGYKLIRPQWEFKYRCY